jgi:ribosomal protein S6
MAEDTVIEPAMADENEENDDELKVYELGFHIVPSVSMENVGVEFTKVKSILEKEGGTFITEEFPRIRPLAYKISKTVRAVKNTYDKAYFGWIKFQVPAEKIPEIKKAMDANDSVLRFIIIKTVKESTLFTPKPSYLRSDPSKIAKRNKEEKEKAQTSPISEEDLDKTIEDLVIS